MDTQKQPNSVKLGEEKTSMARVCFYLLQIIELNLALALVLSSFERGNPPYQPHFKIIRQRVRGGDNRKGA